MVALKGKCYTFAARNTTIIILRECLAICRLCSSVAQANVSREFIYIYNHIVVQCATAAAAASCNEIVERMAVSNENIYIPARVK